ncbi:MAG: NAD(P)-dependent oxidoreductase [Candidatus Micrarchaeota archaeon]|nr:NAD(P)-dependent oxidoreductase [Candidatus Micrarchaeota archaeon]
MPRILALGGCGFIGSYIVRKLLEDGHEVTAVDNFSKYGTIKHDFYSNPGFRLITKDVRQMQPSEYKDYDIIICLAALIGGISYFHRIPYSIAKENTDILTKSIDCTVKASPKAVFYYISSSMVYERMSRPVTEEDAVTQPVPITNYGMQKLFGEFVVRGAKQEIGLNYVIVRPFNAVGSGELPKIKSNGDVDFGMSHVIPDFAYKAIVKQTPFEIFGDGKQVRTFTHAKDIADAFALLVKKDIRNDDFNICGNNAVEVGELAGLVWKKVNGKQPMPPVKHVPAPKDDVRFRVGVSEKAKRVLGWTPKYDMDYILEDTCDFIKKNLKRVSK